MKLPAQTLPFESNSTAKPVKLRPIIFVVPAALLVLALVSGFVLVLRLFFLSMLVLLAGYLWTLLAIRGIHIKAKKPPERCQVGGWFDEEVTAFNTSKVPKFLVAVAENTNLPGYHSITALDLPRQGSFTWQTGVHLQRRGRYQLGSFTVTVDDPFGLFSRSRKLGEPRDMLVYPATADLPFFEPSSPEDTRYGPGLRSTRWISPNASSVREYVIGDALNHIHWPSTAHSGKLMVKLFDIDRSHSYSDSIWIVADMHHASCFGEGNDTTEEYTASIAASLTKKYLDRAIRVGLVASGDRRYIFPPEKGELHFWRLMEALALMRADGKVPVEQVLSSHLDLFGANSTVIVITSSGADQVIAPLQQIRNRGSLAVAILLDPTTFGGGFKAANITHRLNVAGIQAYLVRKGDDLSKALDSRTLSAVTRYY